MTNQRVFIPVNQEVILPKLENFLKELGESLPDKGHCNGFVALFLRACLIGQHRQFFSRLVLISELAMHEVQTLGKLLYYYRQHYQTISSDVKTKNTAFVDANARHSYISTLARQITSKQVLQQGDGFSLLKLRWIEELYQFTHSLIFAQGNTEAHLTFTEHKGYVSQRDFIEILEVLEPNAAQENPHLKLSHPFRFGMNFRHSDLITFLKKMTSREWVVIRGLEPWHVIVMWQAGNDYFVYDPGSPARYNKMRDLPTAVRFIGQALSYPNSNGYYPFRFDIYRSAQFKSTPFAFTEESLLDDMFGNRGITSQLNIKIKNYNSLDIACLTGNAKLVKGLLKRGAEITEVAYCFARTKEIAALLKKHTGILWYVKTFCQRASPYLFLLPILCGVSVGFLSGLSIGLLVSLGSFVAELALGAFDVYWDVRKVGEGDSYPNSLPEPPSKIDDTPLILNELGVPLSHLSAVQEAKCRQEAKVPATRDWVDLRAPHSERDQKTDESIHQPERQQENLQFSNKL